MARAPGLRPPVPGGSLRSRNLSVAGVEADDRDVVDVQARGARDVDLLHVLEAEYVHRLPRQRSVIAERGPDGERGELRAHGPARVERTRDQQLRREVAVALDAERLPRDLPIHRRPAADAPQGERSSVDRADVDPV